MQTAFDQRVNSAPPAPPIHGGLIGVGHELQREAHGFAVERRQGIVRNSSVLFPELIEQRQWRGESFSAKLDNQRRDIGAAQTELLGIFAGSVGATVLKALELLSPQPLEEKTTSALAFLDGLIGDAEVRGFDKDQEKHLHEVQKSL